MLAAQLRDAAIAAAKGWQHTAAEPRHVLYAAARQLRDRAEVAPFLAAARAALEPRGSAVETPSTTPDSEALLATLVSDAEVIAALQAAYGTGPSVTGDARTATAQDQVTTATPSAKAHDPAHPPRESVAQVLAELEGLIGLGSVKRRLSEVIAVVQANQERSRAGKGVVSAGLHLVFTGPPGTGKTTVARLVARLYAAAGALPGANFTEVGRADLVAGYVGQTAIKTTEVIGRTRPGVLFIDEAYALTPRHSSDFGAEAISTVVKAMEDHRTELAVIAAGYGDEMAEFVTSNPGLRSRFKTFIEFPDYTPDQLVQIFAGFAEEAAIDLAPGVLDAAQAVFAQAVTARDFGNARFARSLFEQAYARMAARAATDGSVTLDEVSVIRPDDIEWQQRGIDRADRPIGFRE
ncbi:MAG: AAA family ATPase [Gemmatimonadales bacterium]